MKRNFALARIEKKKIIKKKKITHTLTTFHLQTMLVPQKLHKFCYN